MDQNLFKPYTIKSALDTDTFLRLWDRSLDPSNNAWTLSNRSYSNKGALSWTRADFRFEEGIISDVSTKIKLRIENDLNVNLVYERINVNGQTSGQMADIHNDYSDDNHITAILFCCPQWNIQWGGSFTVYDLECDQYMIFPYIPNNLVVIPSQLDHYGESPNHFTQEMRVTIALMYEIVS